MHIPSSLREEMWQRIHQGHLEEKKCQTNIMMSNTILKRCSECEVCQQHRPQPVESLITTPPLKRPWKKAVVDLCKHNGKQYLVMMNYFSRYPEVVYLKSTTVAYTINK